uniref:Uncharacterized protein n=1 Tax=Aegilops tauschii TaxID=37682 RepID=M8BKH6_AEGTA
MGSRVAASLLRRGRDQASALMTIPRLPRSAPAPPPAPSRVGSGSCGGGARHLPPPPPPQSAGGLFAASRVASYHAFRSFGPKVTFCPQS